MPRRAQPFTDADMKRAADFLHGLAGFANDLPDPARAKDAADLAKMVERLCRRADRQVGREVAAPLRAAAQVRAMPNQDFRDLSDCWFGMASVRVVQAQGCLAGPVGLAAAQAAVAESLIRAVDGEVLFLSLVSEESFHKVVKDPASQASLLFREQVCQKADKQPKAITCAQTVLHHVLAVSQGDFARADTAVWRALGRLEEELWCDPRARRKWHRQAFWGRYRAALPPRLQPPELGP